MPVAGREGVPIEGVYSVHRVTYYNEDTHYAVVHLVPADSPSAVGFAGYYFSQQANQDMNDMYNQSLKPIQWLNDTRAQIRANEAGLLYIIEAGEAEKIEEQLQAMGERGRIIQANWKNYRQCEHDDFEKEQISMIEKNMAQFPVIKGKIVGLAQEGRPDEALLYLKQNTPVLQDIQNRLQSLTEYKTKQADQIKAKNDRQHRHEIRWLLAIICSSLLAGLLAGQRFDTTLVGDASLSKRPMRRVIEPLARMGAHVAAEEGGVPPLRIGGGRRLHGIDYTLPVASAQVKSAVLLAGLYADGETCVHEPHPTRDYTERMLAAFGWPIDFAPGRAVLCGGGVLQARDVDVPADFSSAAFFLVAASLVPGSELRLPGVGVNPRRTGLLTALRLMGADIRAENAAEQGGEPVADLVVRHAPLHGIDVPEHLVPDMIDEFPALFIAAAAAHGTTRVSGAAELRVKESDRLAAMASGLRSLGIAVDERADGALVQGGHLLGGCIDSRGDHRIAMSFALAGLVANAPVRIGDCANVATSFPDFAQLAGGCGFALAPDGG